MSEKAVRSTTTKKTVRKAAPKKAASKTTAAKKTTTRKATTRTAQASRTTTRKAPTPVAAKRADTKMTTQIRIIGIFVFLLIVGGSIAVGVSGDGQINIEGTFAERKAEATPEERTRIESIPVQDTNPLPDGGLVPSGVPVEVPKLEPVATSTEEIASSTDAAIIASSTDATSEEVTEEIVDAEVVTTEGEVTSEEEPVTEEVPVE